MAPMKHEKAMKLGRNVTVQVPCAVAVFPLLDAHVRVRLAYGELV